MTDIVCPVCRQVTPPFRFCLVCNTLLDPNLDRTVPQWSLSRSLADMRAGIFHLAPWSRRAKAAESMDPRLRRDCRRITTHDIRQLETSSVKEREVAVIAKVTKCEKFEELVKELGGRIVTRIRKSESDKTTIVTARIPADEAKVESLRNNRDLVTTLKAAKRIRSFTERTNEKSPAAECLPVDVEETDTSKVIVGVVDFGLDFVHQNFRDKDGTRILALWDQKATTGGNPPPGFEYGRLIERDEINEALRHADPYKALGYEVPKDSLLDTGAHGTYVTDVAAGNGRGSSSPGLAPQAGIVFVDMSTTGTGMTARQSVGSTFGDTVQLLEAVHFIFNYANGRPCVINISLGTNGGPHDGKSPVEEGIDWLVSRQTNRAVVIAAGNSFGKSLHATGTVTQGGYVDLKWRIPRFDPTGNELEIWYSGQDRFTVELRDARHHLVARVRPNEIWEETSGSKRLITAVNRLHDPNNEDNMVNIFFDRGVEAGEWTVRLYGDSVRDATEENFHAWIERDESGQSRFVRPKDTSYRIDNRCTLSSIACGRETIVVSSYDAHEPDLPVSESSSAGPTRDARGPHEQQPTIAAPGENVLAAHSGTLVLRHRQSGTSMAAAAVTGIVALMLSAANTKGMDLPNDEIRSILTRSVLKTDAGEPCWTPELGFGRVCARAALAAVRNRKAKGLSGGQSI